MSETVYNLLRSSDILWAGDITGTAQRITLSHIWARQLISSEAFARIFKPGHTYTLSYSGKVIEPAPDTAYREDRLGFALYTSAGGWSKSFSVWEYHDNPPAGYTFHKSRTFTTFDSYPGDVEMLAYSDYSRDENGVGHKGIVEISDLMIVEGSTPAAWAPAEGEALTADGGGGGMTEPTNLVNTQPDETHLYSATVASGGHVGVWASGTSGFVPMSLSANTDVHAAITVMSKSGALDAGTIYLSINYTDSAGHSNWMTTHNAIGVGASWTRIEMTVTIPAGMTIAQVAVGLSKTASLYMTNLTVYPLTGGRIVRARGANDGSKPTGVMTWNGTKGTLKTKEYSVDDVCTIQSDPNLKCINFVFE